MSTTFARLMADATRLTRAGDLRGATAAIKAALRGAVAQAPAAGSAADVIDIEAREVHDDANVALVHEALDAPTMPLAREAPEDFAAPMPPAPRAGEFIDGSHIGAAGMREYKLYVPPGHHGQPLPLVVMLHGCTQNPDDFAAGTGMNELAMEREFFVLYPAQSQTANPSRCWNWFKHNHQQRGRGEPALLAGMTREVIARHPIDPQRVYVAGLSAGGAMAAILGDTHPELFAAVGVHSGLPAGAANDLNSALRAMGSGVSASRDGSTKVRPPTIVFHGDQDGTVHPANGERFASGVADTPQRGRSEGGRDYTRTVYREAGHVVAEHWTVHGAGHAWSGGSSRGSFTDASGPDASAEMLRFFLAHPQPPHQPPVAPPQPENA
jgi:poly(hydroxyalkanoate) depolymerase family esterase